MLLTQPGFTRPAAVQLITGAFSRQRSSPDQMIQILMTTVPLKGEVQPPVRGDAMCWGDTPVDGIE